MAEYTGYCKNGQNWKSAIKLIKINNLVTSSSLSYVFSIVWEYKVPLEFWIFQQNVDFFALLGFGPKKPKNGQKCTFYEEKLNSEGTFT